MFSPQEVPFKRILAMDLSLNLPAFAVIRVYDGAIYIEDVRHVDNKNAKLSHAEKLKRTADELQYICSKYYGEIDVVVREKGFSRFATTTQALFKVVGVSDLTVYEKLGINKIEEIPPTAIKSIIGGYGKATKDEVEDGLRAYLQKHQKDYVFATDDESDAVAVAITYAYKKGWLK